MIAGRYELRHEVGRGGSTSVWVGHDAVLDRVVALKRLGYSPGSAEVDDTRAEREAHLAARVHHPNIVSVYDIADDDDHSWLVMEYIDGPTLADLCDGLPLPADRAARLLGQVADALAAAHAAGLIHRDVKPSNVFVAEGDIAKLGDFGIARREIDEALTRTGLITGSPAYLAPEIARGRTATSASDVWAFGITAFHAATGRAPYDVEDGDVITAVQRILDDPTPMLPAHHPLAPVVSAAMQQDPDARATMREIADLVRDIVEPGAPHRSALADLLVDHVPREDLASDHQPLSRAPRTAAQTMAAAAAGATGYDRSTQSDRPTQSTPLTAAAPTQDRHATRVSELPAQHAAGRPGHAAPTRDRRLGLVVAAAVAVFAAVATGVYLTAEGDSGDSTVASAPGSPSGSASGPTVSEQLEQFATDYVNTAAGDPGKGFALLTSDYQQASGGLSGYESFWGRVRDVQVERVSPDPDAMRVTYIYSYEYEGSRRTETVTLQLTKDGDRYLIDGADSV